MSSFIQGVSGSLFGALPAMNPVAVLTDNSGVANLTSVGTRRAVLRRSVAGDGHRDDRTRRRRVHSRPWRRSVR